jgi:5'-3' exonuclease
MVVSPGRELRKTMDKRPIVIIDGMNLFVRHFAVNEAVTTQGDPCGGVVGFLKALYHLSLQFSPAKMYVVWEQGGGCPRRKKLFPEYKANRMKIKSEFKSINLPANGLPSKRWIMDDTENKIKQTKMLVDAIKNLPVCQLYVGDTECDDVIGYLIRHKLKGEDALKIVVSSDRDFYQLLDEPNVKIFNPADKSFHDGPIVKVKVGKDKNKMDEHVQIPARNYVLVRTMTGDDSDNIPGVPGMGFKTAVKLFPSLTDPTLEETIDGLLEAAKSHLTEKKPLKAYGSVASCEEIIRRNWQLMYLSSSTLAPTQISKIEYAVDNFKPKMNKLGLIKSLLAAGVVSNLDFDRMAYQMQISLITS